MRLCRDKKNGAIAVLDCPATVWPFSTDIVPFLLKAEKDKEVDSMLRMI